MADLQGRKVFKVFNQDFIVDERYNVTKELGQGAYGIVCAATNNQTGEGVAIKKVTNVFSKKILAKRALREIKLLQHFRGHRNITCLYDMDIPRPDNFNETYLYEELMECDLAAIIRSGQPLTDAHFQSFIYQILCGLKYIHSANVLHRDLKPGNLLVNADCELKICDFGLARGFSMDPEENAGYMTEYVATRWYRAPEIMLSFQSYTKAIDVWSVGCILAELLGGRPFFKGRDYVDQLNQILHYLGTPNEDTLSRIGSPRAQEYVRNLPYMPKVPFQRLFHNANLDALDLLDRMLAFDPSSRISVEEALEHRYLHIWHDASDEPNCPETFDFHFEVVEDVPEMRKMILAEVQRFRQYVRVQPQAQMGGSTGQPQSNVPIPDNTGQWSQEDPRPQEASASHHTQNMGLEQDLQGGLDAMHQVTVTLTPSENDQDFTRVITLNQSTDFIIIGRASKTTSKGLFAASDNAWFDSPIMSREHAKMSVTYDGKDMGSTHGTWLGSRRLAPFEKCTLRSTSDVVTFGSTILSGAMTYNARSFSVELSQAFDTEQAVAGASSFSSPVSQSSGFHVPDEDNDSQSEASEAGSCEIGDSHPITFSVPSSGDELDESDDDIVITAHRRSRALRATNQTYKRLPSPDLGESTNQPDDQKIHIRVNSQAGSAVDPIDVEEALPDVNDTFENPSEDEDIMTHIGSPKGKIADETTKPRDENEAATSFSSPSKHTDAIPIDSPSQLLSSRKDEVSPGPGEIQYLSPYCVLGKGEPDSDEDENFRVQRVESTAGIYNCNQNTAPTCSIDVGPSFYSRAHTLEPPKNLPSESFVQQAPTARRESFNAASHPPVEGPADLDLLCRPLSPPLMSRRDVSPISYSQLAEAGSDSWDSSSEGESIWESSQKIDPYAPTHRTTYSENPNITAFTSENRLPAQGAGASSYKLDPSYFSKSNWPRPLARAPSPSDAALARKATADSSQSQDIIFTGNHFDFAFDDLGRAHRPNKNSWPCRIRLSEAPWQSTSYMPALDQPAAASSAVPQRDDLDELLEGFPGRLPSHRPQGSDYEDSPFSKNYRSSFHSVVVPPLPRDGSASPVMQKQCLVKLKFDKAGNIVREKRVAKPPSRKLEFRKPTKLEISDLINPHAEGPQTLKRKAEQISSEEVQIASHVSTLPLEQKDNKTVAEAGPTERPVQDQMQAIVESPNGIVDAPQEGPARKKVKLSGSKAGTVGKIVSGVCLGLVGALSAFVYSTPAEVWEEALREAVQAN
ncbi:MAG: hypothetical protein LQ352_002563 [Teloschistes flavicans]|nr:MAG: hypothetical protein LQ352_002563 [Teloschistes flavicans]